MLLSLLFCPGNVKGEAKEGYPSHTAHQHHSGLTAGRAFRVLFFEAHLIRAAFIVTIN